MSSSTHATFILRDCQDIIDTLLEIEILVQRITTSLTSWYPLTEEDYQVYFDCLASGGVGSQTHGPIAHPALDQRSPCAETQSRKVGG